MKLCTVAPLISTVKSRVVAEVMKVLIALIAHYARSCIKLSECALTGRRVVHESRPTPVHPPRSLAAPRTCNTLYISYSHAAYLAVVAAEGSVVGGVCQIYRPQLSLPTTTPNTPSVASHKAPFFGSALHVCTV